MRFSDHINVYELTLLDKGNLKDEGEDEKIKELQSYVPNKLNKKWGANTIFEERFSIRNLTIFIQMWETVKYKIENDERIYTSDLYMEVKNDNDILYLINVDFDYYKLSISKTPSKNKTYVPLEDIPITVDKDYKEF